MGKYYNILVGQNWVDLERKVDEYIEKGWVPSGGLFVYGQYGDNWHYQAVYKEISKKK